MTAKTTLARIYVEDAAWLHQLRRVVSSERGQDMTIADTVHVLREVYEAQNGEGARTISGAYYTPPEVAKIIDPAAGSAEFLGAAADKLAAITGNPPYGE